jgi:hypothetical protein
MKKFTVVADLLAVWNSLPFPPLGRSSDEYPYWCSVLAGQASSSRRASLKSTDIATLDPGLRGEIDVLAHTNPTREGIGLLLHAAIGEAISLAMKQEAIEREARARPGRHDRLRL